MISTFYLSDSLDHVTNMTADSADSSNLLFSSLPFKNFDDSLFLCPDDLQDQRILRLEYRIGNNFHKTTICVSEYNTNKEQVSQKIFFY